MKNKLITALKNKGYSANKLAKELNIHRSNIYNHIAGHSSIGIAKAKKIAHFLNISLDDIYADN